MPSFGSIAELPLSSATFGLSTVTVQIENSVFSTGVLAVTVENDVVIDISVIQQGVTSEIFANGLVFVDITQEIPFYWGPISLLAVENNIFSTADKVLSVVFNRVYEKGVISAGVQNNVTELTYAVSVTLGQFVESTGVAQVTFQQTVYDASGGAQTDPAGDTIPAGLMSYGQATPVPGTPTDQTNYWTAKVLLAGLDVSVNLTGTVMVDKEENAAGVAEFTLKPTAGLVDLTQWVRAEVEIYYVPTDLAGVPRSSNLLFKGFVDVPTYSPQTRLTTFTCTDELQKAFESKTTEEIDDVVGGYWSEHVFSEDTDKWSYAQDRLSTIPYTLDYDVNLILVKTAWLAKGTPDYTLNEAVIIDGSVSVSLANSRSIVNTIDVGATYQYDAFKDASIRYSWGMSPSVPDGAAHYTVFRLENNQVVEAVESSGWVFGSQPLFIPWPPTGWYAGAAVINPDRSHIVGTTFYATKRYRQYTNSEVAIKLYSPKSVESMGVLKDTESFSLAAEYSEDADNFEETVGVVGVYEAELNTRFADDVDGGEVVGQESFIGITDVSFLYTKYVNDYPVLESEGEDTLFDLSSTLVANTKDDFQSVLEVLQNLYKNTIIGSHRNNVVSITMLMEPNVTRQHTVKIDTYAVKATGKVKQVTHLMDISAGSAHTTVSISVSRSTGVGIPDTDTPLDNVVAEPGIITPADTSSVSGFLSTWFQAKQGGTPTNFGMRAYYNHSEFLVNFPAIGSEAVNEVTDSTSKDFIVNVPDEELILNA